MSNIVTEKFKHIFFLLLAILIILSGYIFDSSKFRRTKLRNEDSLTTTLILPRHTIAEALAKIDAGNYKWLDKDDYHITRIDFLLRKLASEFNTSVDSVGDAVCAITEELKHRKLDISNYQVLKEISSVPSLNGSNIKFGEFISLYALGKINTE